MFRITSIDPPLCVLCMQAYAQTTIEVEYDFGTSAMDVCLECICSSIIEFEMDSRPAKLTQVEINEQRQYC